MLINFDPRTSSINVWKVPLGVVMLTWSWFGTDIEMLCFSLRTAHGQCCHGSTQWFYREDFSRPFITWAGGMAVWDYMSGSSGWIWHSRIIMLCLAVVKTHLWKKPWQHLKIHSHPFKFLSGSAVTVLLCHLSECHHFFFVKKTIQSKSFCKKCALLVACLNTCLELHAFVYLREKEKEKETGSDSI